MMKKGRGKNGSGGKLLPNSWRIVSSCLKTVSTNASTVVRSAGASVASAIASSTDPPKDQVTWASFDELEIHQSMTKHVLLLGYLNGFQVIDVEDATNFSELVSRHDSPVTFLQMMPTPTGYDVEEKTSLSHPLLLVVAGDANCQQRPGHTHSTESLSENSICPSNTIRFYSLKSNCYVKSLSFPSAVLVVKSSAHIIAVGLKLQIYCINALTLEKQFTVSTYPVPQFEGQGPVVSNPGYGPMALGPRWLAYTPDRPYVPSMTRLSPMNLTPGIRESASPVNGSLMTHYAMESGKQLAAGIINLGDKGYRTLSGCRPLLLADGVDLPGWDLGKLAGSEMDKGGTVVIKDVCSSAIVSQFRAHISPISALCFDRSGTLLVTASEHGHNMNVFRIMPSCSPSRPDYYDWNSSHVHLYRLHRGVTAATIQDICFSHCSHFIAIISSKSTCHIFAVSPFGGDVHFRTLQSHGNDAYPISSPPWWSASSFTGSQKKSLPPSTLTQAVLMRIKRNKFGMFKTVGISSPATRMTMAPSGAIAATFRASITNDVNNIHPIVNPLEHLLVYTPSGFVVQYRFMLSSGKEVTPDSPGYQPASYVATQCEEFTVNALPVQWWDVRRRSDFSERGECDISKSSSVEGLAIADSSRMLSLEGGSIGLIMSGKNDALKASERSSWYISNAEIQMHSGRAQIWQNPKICLYMMSPQKMRGCAHRELEIETVPCHEVEIKQKDLLPMFDREVSFGCDSSALENRQATDKVDEAVVIFHSNPASLSSTESSDGGSSRRVDIFSDLDQLNIGKALPAFKSSLKDQATEEAKARSSSETHAPKHKLMNSAPFPAENKSIDDLSVENSSSVGFSLGSSTMDSIARTADVVAEMQTHQGGLLNADFELVS